MEIVSDPSAEDLRYYDAWLRAHPQGTLWQSLEWKEYQQSIGRTTRLYLAREKGAIVASALVVIDTTTLGLSTWNIPRGPIGSEARTGLLERILADAKCSHCLTLYFSPSQSFFIANFSFPIRSSGRHEQPEASSVIDLTKSEEEILSAMKPKGRYNISIAKRHNVSVRQSSDTSAFLALVKETAKRDGFKIPPKSHYQAFLECLRGSFLLLAYPAESQEPISGLLGVSWGSQGIYYYGASSHASRALMAPYLLQWEAMRHCKARGCTSYDLFGIAPPDALPHHPWKGVTEFKEKLGGTLITYPPEREIVLRPIANALLQLKRKFF
ncbi:MAG: peptidoglycan bridge formation glycyltransferase FemA/FemB family protein [Candidatus Peribacteraceae bacterium]|nr:peptidoglycan bridge formation glycyltransferase FemA/FemB family protein [Candidatus Peribacteraceae bacterium]